MAMSSSAITPSPLDQLEAQVNLVLEHTGRIFAASARNQKSHATINSAARLKHVYSAASNDFHDALDILEAELAFARAVMRRDLASCRTQALAVDLAEKTTSEAVKDVPKVATHDDDQDVTMNGVTPKAVEQSEAKANADIEIIALDENPELPPENAGDSSQAPQDALQIEIPSGEHQGDNQTDAVTGTYSNFDFESLFNDPSSNPSPDVAPASDEPMKDSKNGPSAVPSAPDATSVSSDKPAQSAENSTNKADDATFDFGDLTSFGGESADVNDNENDNISSLLPGLESYANGPSDSAPQSQPADAFNIFDAVGAPELSVADTAAGKTDNKDEKKSDQTGGDQRDDTFDALMNFDNFDMGTFGGEEGEGGDTGFDASFFDI